MLASACSVPGAKLLPCCHSQPTPPHSAQHSESALARMRVLAGYEVRGQAKVQAMHRPQLPQKGRTLEPAQRRQAPLARGQVVAVQDTQPSGCRRQGRHHWTDHRPGRPVLPRMIAQWSDCAANRGEAVEGARRMPGLVRLTLSKEAGDTGSFGICRATACGEGRRPKDTSVVSPTTLVECCSRAHCRCWRALVAPLNLPAAVCILAPAEPSRLPACAARVAPGPQAIPGQPEPAPCPSTTTGAQANTLEDMGLTGPTQPGSGGGYGCSRPCRPALSKPSQVYAQIET